MWQLRIEDPSGETRLMPLQGTATLGKGADCSIPLRDPTASLEAAILWPTNPDGPSLSLAEPGKMPRNASSPYWIRIPKGAPSCLLGDLSVREAQLPAGLPVRIGESRITVESSGFSRTLPVQPSSVRHWITRSDAGAQLLWMARKAAATPLSLYLAGETGTGKEVLAHLLHAWSERASGPFVPLHCGALALSLAESELFGHVKGAFTGAIHQRPGALMQAHNGTLFLDEVGDLPLDIQVKLLRFLENGEIRPVGADRPSRADVRILCATHHPLEKLIEEGRFRRDLYYRLASVTLHISPLRSRPEDIELLSQKFSADLGRSLSPRALLRLKAHSWPGNVRELRHAIERASGLAGPFSPVLAEESFEFLLSPENVSRTPALELGTPVLSLQEMERVMLLKALRLANGNRAAAAKILGVARSTLFEMLKRHKVVGPKQRHESWEVGGVA
jgi:transcriptional regulator with PAS, ATPase and Fis domain